MQYYQFLMEVFANVAVFVEKIGCRFDESFSIVNPCKYTKVQFLANIIVGAELMLMQPNQEDPEQQVKSTMKLAKLIVVG